MIQIVKHVNFKDIEKDLEEISLILSETGNNDLLSLMERVPVHIVDPSFMEKYFDHNFEYFYPKEDFKKPRTEYLGVYCSQWKDLFYGVYKRAIFICPERIEKYAGTKRNEYKYLLTKVTIHEFCHAFMDIIPGSGKYSISYIGYWMEESMANVMTLKILERYIIKCKCSNDIFSYAIDFMTKQPDAYNFAVKMWNNRIQDFELWSWNKEKFLNSNNVRTWVDNAKKGIIDPIIWDNIKNEMLPVRPVKVLRVILNNQPLQLSTDASKIFQEFVENVGVNKVKQLNIISRGQNIIIDSGNRKSNYKYLTLSNKDLLLVTSSTDEKLDIIRQIIQKLSIDAQVVIL